MVRRVYASILNLIRFDSIRFDSIRFDSIRLWIYLYRIYDVNYRDKSRILGLDNN